MAISLNKGGNLSLSKSEPGLMQISVGLGWQARATAGTDFDLDASCFLLDANGKMRGDADFIFYNQLKSPDGAVEHQGDIQSGSGAGDDEQILVNLAGVAPEIAKLVFTVTIHDAETRRQNFGQVQNAFIRVVNAGNSAEIVRYDLSEDASTETAMVFGELYRHNGEWKFRAVGQGFAGGLGALLANFGGEESTNSAPTPAPVAPTPAPVQAAPTSAVPPPPPPIQAAPAPIMPPVAPPTPAPIPTPPPSVAPSSAPPVSLTKITLDKRGDTGRVNLQKGGAAQKVHINLNWNAPEKKKGLFAAFQSAPDLDLGCMFRLKTGEAGVIQPLGGNFGARDRPPFIFLDKDDRSGAAQDGENLFLFRPELIDLVMVFALVYEGASDFAQVGGRLNIKNADGSEIFMQLNTPEKGRNFCAICTIRATATQIEITKEEQYFRGHPEADQRYGFGFRWAAGSK